MGKIAAILVMPFLFLSACASDLKFALPKDQPLDLHIYAHGHLIEKCTIAPHSTQLTALEDLLSAYRAGWKSSPVTFAPGKLVTGAGFSINFLDGFMVVSYGRKQVTRSVPNQAFAFLGCKHGT